MYMYMYVQEFVFFYFSLEKLKSSCQKLTLNLLSFITDNQARREGILFPKYSSCLNHVASFVFSLQDLPVVQENQAELGMLPAPGLSVQQTVPLPTHNLMFADGRLQHWSGL